MDGVIMPCLLWVNCTHLIKAGARRNCAQCRGCYEPRRFPLGVEYFVTALCYDTGVELEPNGHGAVVLVAVVVVMSEA